MVLIMGAMLKLNPRCLKQYLHTLKPSLSGTATKICECAPASIPYRN